MSGIPLRKRIRVRPLLLLILCGWLFALHVSTLLQHGNQALTATLGDGLLAHAPEMGSANAVTSVVVSYRGFDTLGEVTVLFLAATGIGLLFGPLRPASPLPPPALRRQPPNEMMVTGIHLLFPVLLLFGVYIIVHGHLSPGGGFQGGVVIATAFFLRMLADPDFTLDHARVGLLEALSGSGFVLFGLAGLSLAATATFLGNFLPHPLAAMGNLISAGVIPLIYILVGIKVGAEVGAIFQAMLEQQPNNNDTEH